MTIKKITCYTLECDQCHQSIGYNFEGEDYVPHHTDPAELDGKLPTDPDADDRAGNTYDGMALPDGSHLCGRCAAVKLCAERGHAWTDWLNTVSLGERYRYCERSGCREMETEKQPAGADA